MVSSLLPPVVRFPGARLEVFVVHHPGDHAGKIVAASIRDHFHGSAYSGLAGGSIEVYERYLSASSDHAGPPVAIPGVHEQSATPLPAPAEYIAIVPVFGDELAWAAHDHDGWKTYLSDIAAAQAALPERIGVFIFTPTDYERLPDALLSTFEDIQWTVRADIAEDPTKYAALAPTHNRELAQAMAQLISGHRGTSLRIFLSHTKHDSPDTGRKGNAARLVKQVRALLEPTRLRTFVDVKDLQAASNWRDELLLAAGSSALLAIRTDLYSSREWCKAEMREAKLNGMPIVIADALKAGERGSFLMDHVPRLPLRYDAKARRWAQIDIERALNRLIDAHLARVLWCATPLAPEVATERVWSSPLAPEPTTLISWLGHQPAPLTRVTIEHPDPPLGPEEVRVLRQTVALVHSRPQLTVRTPTSEQSEEATNRKPLTGLRVGVSVSESEDLGRLGLSFDHTTFALQYIVRMLVVGGATVVYGGLAKGSAYTDVFWDTIENYAIPDQPVQMYLALPVHNAMATESLRRSIKRKKDRARIVCLDEHGVDIADPLAQRKDVHLSPQSTRASLTALRERIADEVDAQVVLGGKRNNYMGVMPGLLEETILTLRKRKPVYVAGGFGGVASDIGAALEGTPNDAGENAGDAGWRQGLQLLRAMRGSENEAPVANGLTTEQHSSLAITHRGSEIAQLVQLGLHTIERTPS